MVLTLTIHPVREISKLLSGREMRHMAIQVILLLHIAVMNAHLLVILRILFLKEQDDQKSTESTTLMSTLSDMRCIHFQLWVV